MIERAFGCAAPVHVAHGVAACLRGCVAWAAHVTLVVVVYRDGVPCGMILHIATQLL